MSQNPSEIHHRIHVHCECWLKLCLHMLLGLINWSGAFLCNQELYTNMWLQIQLQIPWFTTMAPWMH